MAPIWPFDSEGNRTRRTKVIDNSYEDYTWDHRNRLTSVTRKSQAGTVLATGAYVYDQFNRLIKRTVDADGAGSGAAADQFFAGFEGINPTLIFDGANSGDLTNRLLWGDIVDELFADEQITNPTSAGNTLWAASDHLGTIRDLVDFSGTAYTVANHRVYDSFGNLTSETNSSVSSLFGFTGKLFDNEFKLSNHWNRWYDPALGKWISEDPIGFAAGDANLGRYVGNNPLESTDPFGMSATPNFNDEWRLDLTGHVHDEHNTTKGAHIQKGKERWDARTLEPIETNGRRPKPLGRSQIREIYEKGIFDEIFKKIPDNQIRPVIEREIGIAVLDEIVQ